jgi:hypothetical protein
VKVLQLVLSLSFTRLDRSLLSHSVACLQTDGVVDLGFGAAIASAAGPAYTVELAHPAYRGTMAGMYNNFWWFGNILAGWTTYGTNE